MHLHRPFLIVLSAPSGAGKTTIAREAVKRLERLRISVSYTSRRPRPGEMDGVDYHFISSEEFEAGVRAGRFLEWARVHGKLYGTAREEVERARKDGVDLILVIDVQGGERVLREIPGAVGVFLFPPSWEELRRRLYERGRHAPEEIERRLLTAREEVEKANLYPYWLVNDDLEETIQGFLAIITAERLRRERWESFPLERSPGMDPQR